MKHLKRMLLLAAAGAALVGPASAVTIVPGTTTDLGAASVGTPLAFNGQFAGSGPFVDSFLFTVPVNGGSGYTVLNLPLSISGIGTFNVLLTGMALFSDTDGTPWNGGETLLRSVAGGPNSLSMQWGPTAAGHMILQVSGTANGTLGGLYNGAISVTPAAVPEAETWAMMLVGAGLVGFQLRRRIKQADTQRLV